MSSLFRIPPSFLPVAYENQLTCGGREAPLSPLLASLLPSALSLAPVSSVNCHAMRDQALQRQHSAVANGRASVAAAEENRGGRQTPLKLWCGKELFTIQIAPLLQPSREPTSGNGVAYLPLQERLAPRVLLTSISSIICRTRYSSHTPVASPIFSALLAISASSLPSPQQTEGSSAVRLPVLELFVLNHMAPFVISFPSVKTSLKSKAPEVCKAARKQA